jgi:DNA-binding SARP family transcriptional activator
VELRILGPLEVCDDSGQPVKLPAGRERVLLAVLALRRGEVVSTDQLVDALWGEQPPPTAAKALQGYVSHLRRLLASAGEGGALVTQSPGYLLRLGDESVDAGRFEVLASRGWRQLDDDPQAAVATFEEGLALWRGPALGEFAFSEFAQREIHRLDELRLETVEGRLEALLRLGRHGAVVAELEARVDEHPLRERLRGQLMLALYRCGRQAEALEVYRDGRRRLANDLGLEPGTDLQRLERQILEQDPALDAPAHVRASPDTEERVDPSAPRARRGRRAAGAIVLLIAAFAGVTVGYLALRDDATASVTVIPPALVVVDPTTNRVVASIPVGSRPVTVAGGEGGVWVGDARDGTVTKVDPATRAVAKTIGIGAPALDVAAGVGGVWVATGGFGEVVLIDPELGAVRRRIPMGKPGDVAVPSVSSVAVGDGRVWASATDGMVRLSPASLTVIDTVDLGSIALQLAAGGGAVWATTFANRAKRVEARSGEETTEFYAGTQVYPIAVGGNAVWVGGNGDAGGELWKVNQVTGSVLFTSRPASDVSGVAFGEGATWTVAFDDATLVRIDPETGVIEARIPIGGAAEDVVVHDGLVWIPVQRPS